MRSSVQDVGVRLDHATVRLRERAAREVPDGVDDDVGDRVYGAVAVAGDEDAAHERASSGGASASAGHEKGERLEVGGVYGVVEAHL